jgi:hypothetical protein
MLGGSSMGGTSAAGSSGGVATQGGSSAGTLTSAGSSGAAGTAMSTNGGAGAGGLGSGGEAFGGDAAGGAVSAGAPNSAGAAAGGEPSMSEAGAAGAGGAPGPTCAEQIERCNGYDDNCNNQVDEGACNNPQNGTTGCTGFVLQTAPTHGYMLCTGAKDQSHAKTTCEGQGMRLAYLETSAENSGVATTIKKLTNAPEVLFGADDQTTEGEWYWTGSTTHFWHGVAKTGYAINGAFVSWAQNQPDNGGGFNTNEDCIILTPANATWSDRGCNLMYPFLCEEPN